MMEVDKDRSGSPLPNGSHQTKRGRGRPRGSLNRKFTTEKASSHNARPSKKVDFFCPDIVIKAKVKKRGRPKKLRTPGRPRKIPLTPEEESERLQRLSVQRKRKLSKPLGRPRIHPIREGSKVKRGRGRPPKSGGKSQSSGAKQASSLDVANGPPRKRGRPSGALKKKRGRPAGSTKIARATDGSAKKRGRPPGSLNKVKKLQQTDGSPRKRGRPPGTGAGPKPKIVRQNPDGTPRKRGRPPGTGRKIKVVVVKKVVEGGRKRGRPPSTGKVQAKKAASADGAPRRKRGRPSKVRQEGMLDKTASGEDDDDTDAPSPKQSRTSDDSSQNPNDDDDTRGSDNDADPEDEDDDDDDDDSAIDCSKVNNTSENEMVSKFKKKK